MLMRGSLRCGGGGPGVLKKIKMEMFPRCLTLLYQSFLLETWETGGVGGGKAERRVRVGGGGGAGGGGDVPAVFDRSQG